MLKVADGINMVQVSELDTRKFDIDLEAQETPCETNYNFENYFDHSN